MITRHHHGQVVWVDASSPTREEVRKLTDEFGLDQSIADELTTPSLRTHVDVREGYLYLVLHLPALTRRHKVAGTPIELDFVVGRDWIITARYSEHDPLHRFGKLFEVESMLNKQTMGVHAGLVFYHMLRELYGALDDELVFLGKKLDVAEERVFTGNERAMVLELSHISRDILNLSQALDAHGTLLSSLEKPTALMFGYEYVRMVRNLEYEYERLSAAIRGHRASLLELRETNDSLLTTKQNEIMKIFTIMAFVTFPLSLFTSLFGMNTVVLPIVGHKWDFWIILGIMCAAAASFFVYFRYKKWL